MLPPKLNPYVRNANDLDNLIRIIGSGSIGGKNQGLVFLRHLFTSNDLIQAYPETQGILPNLVVIGTDVSDTFLEINGLHQYIDSDHTESQIARAFRYTELRLLPKYS